MIRSKELLHIDTPDWVIVIAFFSVTKCPSIGPLVRQTVALWAVDWARWLLGYMGENFYLFDMAETM